MNTSVNYTFREYFMTHSRKRVDTHQDEHSFRIGEVTLGALHSDGGTRRSTITIGGEISLPFRSYCDNKNLKYPVTMDCFDTPIKTTNEIKKHFEDIWGDPAECAKRCVEKYNADMVTIHLISTDPFIKDTSPSEAAKTVENVLQAVDVPIVIGGSGNPGKDPEVLERAAQVSEGERVLLASANLNMDWKRIGRAARTYGHVILSWTQMDFHAQRALNKKLLDLGIPSDRIIMDPTTAALGYGLEYAISNIERIKIAAMKGDSLLQMPISAGVTNSWGSREAWMNNDDWGLKSVRGPLWEFTTGVSLLLSGVNIFMMLHPTSVSLFQKARNYFLHEEVPSMNYYEWIKA